MKAPATTVLIACLTVLSLDSQALPPTVRVVRLPVGAIQPQVAVDSRGIVHVVYFRGEPANGDLFYATLDEAANFSSPLRVNSEPDSAIATGTVRGAQMAIGKNGRIHVAWNGSNRATPEGPGGATPMLYSRFDPEQRTFEAQRNLLQFASGLDGGGAIAADERGRVYVAWHAGGPDSKGEGDRRVWMARSLDDGRTFAREQAVSDVSTGACGCCGMGGLIDRDGSLYLLYRSAREIVHRDTFLLTSRDGGIRFTSTRLQEWNIGACPMSTFALANGTDGVLAAWETDGQVQFARVSGSSFPSLRLVEAPGSTPTVDIPRWQPILAEISCSPGPKGLGGRKAEASPGKYSTRTAARLRSLAEPRACQCGALSPPMPARTADS